MSGELLGFMLIGFTILIVWWLCSAAEQCRLPEEPWIWWDGEDPEDL